MQYCMKQCTHQTSHITSHSYFTAHCLSCCPTYLESRADQSVALCSALHTRRAQQVQLAALQNNMLLCTCIMWQCSGSGSGGIKKLIRSFVFVHATRSVPFSINLLSSIHGISQTQIRYIYLPINPYRSSS